MKNRVAIDQWTRDKNENGKLSHEINVVVHVDDAAAWEGMSEDEQNQYILDRIAPDLGPGVKIVPKENP